MSAMIVLTIGPVQSYISQARRTQDLWQGSRILSYLAGVGVYQAHDEAGWENVIYPRLPERSPSQQAEGGAYASIPNRLVILWQGDENGAEQCARNIKKAIEAAWLRISENTREYFLKDGEGNKITGFAEVEKIWQRQEKNWLECYWVVTRYDDAKHAESINIANAAMGARKLLRNFPRIDEGGRKCSITGEHEALQFAGEYVEFWNGRKAEQRNLALLGKHERLSAISTIKRFAHEKKAGNHSLQFPNRFPSTSSIASASFRYDVLQALDRTDVDTSNLRQKLQEFIQALLTLFKKNTDLFFTQDGQSNPEYFGLIEQTISKGTLEDELVRQFRSIDGDFLFEDTLISKTIEEYSGQIPGDRQMSEVQQALAGLLKATNALNIPRPQPYLVILSMDGDHMGKTLGALQDADQHKLFSETLASFAQVNVKRIVEEEHLGRVVYAGGDDVLALLPVRDALQAAEKLRSEFEEVVAAIGIKNHKNERVTSSTGLAYVHHTHNLQDAVHAAISAQKEIAKEKYGRGALGVEFLRRSGEPRSMGHKWQRVHNSTVATVTALTTDFRNGLSRSFPYDLAQIAYSMGGELVPEAARLAELTRIIKRRLPEAKRDQAGLIAERVFNLISPEGTLEKRWQNVQSWLELARFIAQTSEAEGI